MTQTRKFRLLILLFVALIAWGMLTKNNNTIHADGPEGGTTQTTAISTKGDYTSPAGLHYGRDLSGKFDSRIDHIMAHTQADDTKVKHSVFREKSRDGVLALLDEAWKKRGPPERQGGKHGRDVYDIDMGRIIGSEGERRIRLVVEADSSEIVTAYPEH